MAINAGRPCLIPPARHRDPSVATQIIRLRASAKIARSQDVLPMLEIEDLPTARQPN